MSALKDWVVAGTKMAAAAAHAAGLGNYHEPVSLGGEAKALAREAVKDVRSTLHQFFYGQPEHLSEPGTPLNPTPQQVTDDVRGRQMEMER